MLDCFAVETGLILTISMRNNFIYFFYRLYLYYLLLTDNDCLFFYILVWWWRYLLLLEDSNCCAISFWQSSCVLGLGFGLLRKVLWFHGYNLPLKDWLPAFLSILLGGLFPCHIWCCNYSFQNPVRKRNVQDSMHFVVHSPLSASLMCWVHKWQSEDTYSFYE